VATSKWAAAAGALTIAFGACRIDSLLTDGPPPAGPPTRLVFTVQPTVTSVRVPITPAVQVTAQDSLGRTAIAFNGPVDLRMGNNPTGGNLLGGTTATAVNGVARFPDVRVDTVGSGYTITAIAGDLPMATSEAFDVMPPGSGRLTLTTQPATTAQSGVVLTRQPVIQLQDGSGNPDSRPGVVVNATIASGPNGGSLTSASATTNAGGLATFSGLAISGAVGDYALRFSATGVIPITSDGVALAAGPPSALTITTQPSGTVQSGAAFPVQPVIQLRDGFGNPVPQSGVAITASIASGAPALSGVNPVSTDGRGATAFTNLTISGPAGTRTLRFSGAGAGVNSAPINVTIPPDPATQVAVNGGNNQTALAGTQVPVPPSVIVRSASGAPVGGVAVTFAVTSGSGSITGANQTSDVNGIAAVGSWTLGTTPGPNTLSATAPGLTGSPVTFSATGSAPAGGTIAKSGGDNQTAPVGAVVPVSPSVLVRDASNAPVAGVVVTFAVASGGGQVTGGSQTTNSSGIATVGTWTLGNTPGTNTMTAAASGFTGSPLTFIATATAGSPSATHSRVAASPTTITAGGSPATITVTVLDALDNPVSGATVTLSVSGTGNTVGQPSGTTGGNGQITGTVSSTVAEPKTVTATVNGSVPVQQTAGVTVQPGSAAQLVFTGQPTTTKANATISPPVVVSARDAFGNTATGFTGAVTMSITPGSGTPLARLSGTPTVNAVSGAATFVNLSIDLPSTVTPYRLNAAAAGGGPAGTTSATFDITAASGSATSLGMVTQPSSTVESGSAFPQQPAVQLRDASGNPVPQSGVPITAAILTGSPALSGTNPVATDGTGTATFSNLTITGAAGPRTLRFVGPQLSPVTSSTVTVTVPPPPASQIAVHGGNNQTAPAGSMVPGAPSVLVTSTDGTPVGGVAVTFNAESGGGSVTGGSRTTDPSGIATVGTWRLGPTPGPNTLTATAPGLNGSPVVFSATGTPGAPSPSQSRIAAAPGSITAGGGASTITVTVLDAGGNPVNGATVTLTVSGSGNTIGQPSGATGSNGQITGTLASTVAETKTIQAIVNGAVTLLQTATVSVQPGAATQIVFAGQPSNTKMNSVISPPVVVTARDAFGNTATGFVGAVTVSIAPGSGTPLANLSGMRTVNAIGGVATFSTLSIDLVSTALSPYRLTAASGGLTATSTPFSITLL
jgi:adhesin/invasin